MCIALHQLRGAPPRTDSACLFLNTTESRRSAGVLQSFCQNLSFRTRLCDFNGRRPSSIRIPTAAGVPPSTSTALPSSVCRPSSSASRSLSVCAKR